MARACITSLRRAIGRGCGRSSSVGGEPELVAQDVNQAALSPDGKTLAFFRPDGNDMVGGAGLQKLWLASPPASQPVQYNRPPFGEHSNYSDATLHFSPDGSKLGVWVSLWRDKADRVQPEFWVIPVGGAAPYMPCLRRQTLRTMRLHSVGLPTVGTL